MATLTENTNRVVNALKDIKSAIIAKGVTPTGKCETFASAIESIPAGGGGAKLLWSNSTPNANFSAQRVTVSNVSNYRYIIIKTCSSYATTSTVTYSYALLDKKSSVYNGIWYLNGLIGQTATASPNRQSLREVTSINSNSITFGDGKFWSYNQTKGAYTQTINVRACVPVEIYGLESLE